MRSKELFGWEYKKEEKDEEVVVIWQFFILMISLSLGSSSYVMCWWDVIMDVIMECDDGLWWWGVIMGCEN